MTITALAVRNTDQARSRPPGARVLVSGTASDAHTWNLVFLELLLAECGCTVRNLGPCVPVEYLVAQCRAERPDLLVLSSVNGHGLLDGSAAIRAVRAAEDLQGLPAVIGGKLTTTGELPDAARRSLCEAGFQQVFTGPDAADEFRLLLAAALDQTPAAASLDPLPAAS
jgi:methylaspartate mutase sigma subunit